MGELAGLLALMAFVPYLLGVYKGEIQPKLSSWFVFMVMDVLTLVGLASLDPQPSLFVPCGYVIGATATFGLAFLKNKDRSLGIVDKICLTLGAGGAILFGFTGDGIVGVAAGLGAMLVAAVPTMVQLWKNPEREGFWGWMLFGAAAVTNLFVPANQVNWETFIFPAVIGAINIPIVFLVLRGKFFKK